MSRRWSSFNTTKKSKYKNKITHYRGLRFDSRVEADRYAYLQILQKAGEISCLETQSPIDCWVVPLNDKENFVKIGTYRVDFRYYDPANKSWVYEDVKGGDSTPLFKWKKKHVEAQYGIKIWEVRYRNGQWECT